MFVKTSLKITDATSDTALSFIIEGGYPAQEGRDQVKYQVQPDNSKLRASSRLSFCGQLKSSMVERYEGYSIDFKLTRF
jgi:hypothetical protein